jgi:hypothetical protein
MPRDLFADLPAAQPDAAPTAAQLRDFAFTEAQRQGVDPGHILPMFRQESGFRADARSPAGAFGPAQLMPGTARELGVNPNDPYDNIRGGITYYKQQLERFKDPDLARAAYNAGPGAVQKYGGVPPFAETQDYVRKTRAARDLFADLPAEPAAPPVPVAPVQQAAAPASPPAQPAEKVSFEAPFQRQVYQGIMEQYKGAKQLGLKAGAALGIVDPKTAQDYSRQLSEEQLLYEAHNPRFQAGRLVGNVAAFPVPLPAAATATVPRLAAAGALQAAIQPVVGPDESFWRTKGVQALTGAVAAPVVNRAVQGLATGAGKLIGARAGQLAPEAAELVRLQKQFDVPLSYSDITGGQFARRAEDLLEYTPVLGTAGSRKVQQQAAQKAATSLTGKLYDDMINTPFKGANQVAQAAAAGNSKAIALQREIANAGDDWNRIIQTSGNLNLFRRKLIADKLYNDVAQKAAGTGWVSTASTRQTVLTEMERLEKAMMPDRGAIQMLSQILDRLDDPGADISFQGMRRFHSDLGDEVSKFYKGTGTLTGSKGVEVVERVRKAVDADMRDFAANSGSPDLLRAWKRADSFFKNKVIPFRDPALAKTLKDAPPDEIFARYIQAGAGAGKDRADEFLRALDPRGQAAVRYGYAARAIEEGMDPTTGMIAPGKVAGALEKLASTRGVVFKGAGKQEMDGFAKIMRHAEAAGEKRAHTVLPQQFLGTAAAGVAGAIHLPLTAAAGGMAGLARLMFTTESGKKYLLAANMLKPGSSAMADLVERASKQLATASARGAGAEQGQPGRILP